VRNAQALPPRASTHRDQDLQGIAAGVPSAAPAPAANPAPAAPSPPLALEDLGPGDFLVEATEMQPKPPALRFDIRARLLCNDVLAQGCFSLEAEPKRIAVRPTTPPERAVRLAGVPIAQGRFLDHPPGFASTNDWVMRQALDAMARVRKIDLPTLQKRLRPHLSSGFSTHGEVDLENLSCTTLDDRDGRLWGSPARINMNHFVYRQAVSECDEEARRRPTDARFGDWLSKFAADWLWPRGWRFPEWLRDRPIHLKPWEERRNWIYRQFRGVGPAPSVARHPVSELEYQPQPFEQAIRVARSDGQEDFAVNFEMLKHRIEWRHFNDLRRWPLAALAIFMAAAWLLYQGGKPAPVLITLVVTWGLMLWVSPIHHALGKKLRPPWPWRIANGLFWLPALLLFLSLWLWQPFYFIIAFLIYAAIRWISVFSHAVMRFGFGYLRRPVRAIGTLILAFLAGWLGVHLANVRNMLVINAEAVAELAGPEPLATYPPGHALRPSGRPQANPIPILMGSETEKPGAPLVRELSCTPILSEPLYALDVLIPIVDLGEESRCDIRRVHEDEGGNETGGAPPPEAAKTDMDPGKMGWLRLAEKMPRMTLGNRRFWWWLKAFYAIAGWIIVSLALLTFTQVNRGRGTGVG
jgi:hypothetical protein